jgi:hypothetical protein
MPVCPDTKKVWTLKDRQEVLYFDRDHFHLTDGAIPKAGASPSEGK